MLLRFNFVWKKVLPFGFNFDSLGFIVVGDDAVVG